MVIVDCLTDVNMTTGSIDESQTSQYHPPPIMKTLKVRKMVF